MATDTIKIGVLFSQTGKMAVTENAHIKGVMLACEEINEAGGIGAKQIFPVLLNPGGDDRKYAEMATDLLVNHNINSIFGCCLSTSRKAVLPVVERFNGVLFYPSVYEGFEYSPNVVYGGAVPNQIVPPLLEYIFEHHGPRIALIGSDTLYAREINRIVKEFLLESGGGVVTETYLPFGSDSGAFKKAIQQCDVDQTDVVLSTVVGEDSVAFYRLYGDSGLREKGVPIASLTTTESELSQVPKKAREGHISVAAYFETIDRPQNAHFLSAFHKKFGNEERASVYSEVGYSLVHLFANAARQTGKFDTVSLLSALSGAVFKAPGGDVFVDVNTNHCTLRPHIGKSLSDGSFNIVGNGKKTATPDPYLVAYDRSVAVQEAR